MFGLIDSERSDGATGRFARRRFAGRFRDVDWSALAAASAALTVQVVGAVTHSQQGSTQSGAPAARPQCPAGYVYNPSNGMCQQTGGDGLFANIDPTVLAVGGVLVLLLSKG